MLKKISILAITTTIIFGSLTNVNAQMGHIIQGAGTINRTMEGAATGGAVDNCGALYWNPAGLSRIKRSTLCLAIEHFSSDLELSSSITAFGMSDTDTSSYGPSGVPAMSYVHVPENSDWTFGIGVLSVAGFGVNFDSSTTNPILTPQPGGFGAISSEFSLGQLCLGASYEVNEKLALGIGAFLSVAGLEVDPFPGAAPGVAGYHQTDMEYTPGYGLHFGILYQATPDWSLGFAHKTKQDFKAFDFETPTADFSFDMDLPSITSLGVSYTGIDKLTLNIDARYIDYDHCDGFAEEAAFAPNWAVKGFGWDSIWQVAIGASYNLNEKWILRCGYSYNQNPIPNKYTFFNVHATALIQHHMSIGFTYRATENLMINAGWAHGFQNTIEGPMYGPPAGGPVAGTNVKAKMSTDAILIGMGYVF